MYLNLYIILCQTCYKQRWVIESLVELLKQESEDLIDAMEESRMELRDFLADFYNDGEEDRSRSRAYGNVNHSNILI